jgi:peptidoglycan/xylan/chitin deacetylase (PgdA/CDA1 family)
MEALHENGFRGLSLLAAAEQLRQGNRFPDRAFVLTFDDGYQSVYEEAFPVLQRHSTSATIFLTVGDRGAATTGARLPSLENRPMLGWREIREMHRSGIDFGAHTLTHRDLTRLPPESVEAEICRSKAVIEDALSAAVASFAYPFGRFDEKSRDIVSRHFDCACSDTLGLMTARSDPYALERVDAYYLRTDALFHLMTSRFFPWYVRARGIPRRIRRAFQRR